jgi:hypothetical protein
MKAGYAVNRGARVRRWIGSDTGSSLAELVISAGITSIVSGIIMSGMLRLGDTENAIGNRTELHSGIRGASELLQRDVSQAGRITLPGPVTLPNAIAATGAQTVTVSSAAGMFDQEQLVVDTGSNEETVSIANVDIPNNTVTATFKTTHAANVPVTVRGGFASGVVPTTIVNGSTASVLKLYGDIHGNGNLVYVEYTCDTAGGNLYRNSVPVTAASKPALTGGQVLMNNLQPNPGGTPCFSYQQKTVGADTYVVGVAITLTLATEFVDPVTNQRQTETQALLSVSPRNIFETWELASLGVTNRVQLMPPGVLNLMP